MPAVPQPGDPEKQLPGQIGTWEWDRRSGRVTWSHALERLHGLQPGTFGGSFDDFIADMHPDDRERVLAQVDEAVKPGGRPYRTEYRIVLPGDGVIRWVEAYGEASADEHGEILGMRGVCRDVTAERNFARQRDAVYNANHALAAATDLDDGLRILIEIIGEAFDCAYVEYRDSVDGGKTLRPRVTWQAAGSPVDADRLTPDIDVASGRGPISRSWRSGEPVWVHDLETEPPAERREAALAAGLRAVFACPVRSGAGVVGVVSAFTRDPLPDEASPTLGALTAEVSQFVRRLDAEAGLRNRERQQAAAARLGRLALDGAPEQELLDEAVRSVSETLGVEYAKVLRLLPGGEDVLLVAGVGWKEGLVGRATVDTGLESQAGYTLRTDASVIVGDLRTEPRFSGPPLLHDHGVVAGISTVIRGPGGQWGVLGAHTSQRRTFSEDDTLFLENVANVLGSAIDRAEAERVQAFLLEANELLFSSLDYRATLRQLAALVVTEVADWCVVYLLDGRGERQPLEIAHRDPEKVELVQRYRERMVGDQGRPNIIDRAIVSGETQVLPRITPEQIREGGLEPETVALLEQLQLRALAVAPLRAREQTLGAILLVSAESGYRYGAAQRQMVEELARRAAIAIDNAQLYEQMSEALRTREDFVSIVSHELRSPLTSIMGYTSRLRRLAGDGRIESSAADSLDVIHREAERMRDTLELFLDMAGLDTGRFAMELVETELRELLERETDALRRRDADLELNVSLPDEPIDVTTDPSRVQTIVANLLSNAVKYGGEPPRISVAIEREADGVVTIRVRDNGRGIPEGERSHIFDRYYRGAESGDGKRGLGLGLYISKRVADRLGATLSFETEEGAGTEFILRLPSAEPPA